MMSLPKAASGKRSRTLTQQFAVIRRVIIAPHLFENPIIAGLRADMQMGADDFGTGHQVQQTVRHFTRIKRAQAQPRDQTAPGDHFQQGWSDRFSDIRS